MIVREPISIVIVYHRGNSFLTACLESVISSVRDEDEILVVINNEDKNVHEFDLHKTRVKYLHYYENLGHAEAANRGILNSQHQHVILSDHDLVFRPSWIDELWLSYHSDISLGAVCCKIINAATGRVLDFGIAFSDFNLGHPYMDLPINHPLVSEDLKTQMICSGGLLFRKNDFNSVNGFNSLYGSLYTDLDFSLKLKAKGKTVAVSASAQAYHFGGDFSNINRDYKASFLKADVKGAFMRDHATMLESDMENYYTESYRHYVSTYGELKKYFFCNLMNVVNPIWYENVFKGLGAYQYDEFRKRSGNRDSYDIFLFDILGYNIMALGVPIAYFVDRFVSVTRNQYWWENRKHKGDIVIDRNGNILTVKQIISFDETY
jgi:N-acetylglucosaminyl-diphospho-decaprenol L-rhamnosyltransferase